MNTHHALLTDELKESLDIVEVISTYLPLKRNGPAYKGSCPFHDDNNLSLDVFPETQTWRCSTGCAERLLINEDAQSNQGDAFAFVSRVEDVSLGQAVRKLAVSCGLAPGTGEPSHLAYGAIKSPRPEAMPPGRRIPGLFQSREAMRPTSPPSEDPYLKLGNLGYKGRVNCRTFEGLAESMGVSSNSLASLEERWRFENCRQPRPGIVVALHTTLQDHCKLEYPNGDKETFDTQGCYDAGEIIWTKSGQASAIVKNTDTGVHVEVALHGVTTRGFCLLTPPGLTGPIWCWPREPKTAGGRARPFYYKTEEALEGYAGIVLESFALDAALLTEYQDISGVVVPVSPVTRSRKSHKDHLDTGLQNP